GRRKTLRKARRRDRERAAAQGQVRTVGARAEEESGRGLEEAERDRVGARKAEAAGGPGAEDRRRLGEERAEAAERAAHQQRDHAEDGGDQEAPRSGSGRDAEEIHGSAGRGDEAALAGGDPAGHGANEPLARGVPQAARTHQVAAAAAAARGEA